ncbi:MAG: DUF3298 domain-containing protein [Bacteroidetes bacterium]|nr:DUF3298 domain-containing protein [Bacteroidota bacterium]
MRYFFSALLISIAIISCNNNQPKQSSTSAKKNAVTQVQEGNYYKRFSGTIAGQPVVLHMVRFGILFQANYYYLRQGRPINLYFNIDTSVINGYIADEPPIDNNGGEQAEWRVIVEANSIKGKWISADKKKTYDIDLKEDCPDGSYPLAMLERDDSVRAKADRASPQAAMSYSFFYIPESYKDKDARIFMEQAVLKAWGADSMHINSIEGYIKKQIALYSIDYKETVADLPDSELQEEIYNFYTSQTMAVLVNDNGWLVLEENISDYSGGAHGNYGVSYMNIDMKGKKLWAMEDILVVDSSKLQTLLEAEARKFYDMAPTAKLEENYLADRIMPNGNVYITSTGIAFVYNPYEIASYAQGIITLFISYPKVKDLLKPQFKNRMGL